MDRYYIVSISVLSVAVCIMLIAYFAYRVRPVGRCAKCGERLTTTTHWKFGPGVYVWLFNLFLDDSAWQEWTYRCKCQTLAATQLPPEMQEMAKKNVRNHRRGTVIIFVCVFVMLAVFGFPALAAIGH